MTPLLQGTRKPKTREFVRFSCAVPCRIWYIRLSNEELKLIVACPSQIVVPIAIWQLQMYSEAIQLNVEPLLHFGEEGMKLTGPGEQSEKHHERLKKEMM